jgi:hypothetical protein
MHTLRNNQFCTHLNKTFYLKRMLTLFWKAKLLLYMTSNLQESVKC